MHIVRMRDGKAVEHWSVADMMSMLQQLGLAPTPGMEQAA
jgi:predicted ester cyclase